MTSQQPIPRPNRRPHDGARIDRRIADLAAPHRGLVSASALRGIGVGRSAITSRMDAGRLFNVLPGIYVVGHYHWSIESLWQAAVLYAGPHGRLIDRSGAEAHVWLQSFPGQISVTGGPAVKSRTAALWWPGSARPSVVQVRRRDIASPSLISPSGLPTAAAAELILGVAASGTLKQLNAAVRNAEYQRAVNDASLRRVLGRGREGSQALRALLDGRVVGATFSRTALEERARDLIAAAGLPTPLTNVDIPVGDQVFNVDFYLPRLGLVIEADGPEHEEKAQQRRDRQRDTALAALGIQVLRFPDYQLQLDPEAVIQALLPWARRAAELGLATAA